MYCTNCFNKLGCRINLVNKGIKLRRFVAKSYRNGRISNIKREKIKSGITSIWGEILTGMILKPLRGGSCISFALEIKEWIKAG